MLYTGGTGPTVTSIKTFAEERNGYWSASHWMPLNFEAPVKPVKTLKLNESHTATVTKDVVTVGCQTFESSKVLELAEMVKEQL